MKIYIVERAMGAQGTSRKAWSLPPGHHHHHWSLQERRHITDEVQRR